MHVCPFCSDFFAPTISFLLTHIGRAHANSSNFQITCGVEQCEATYKSFRRFKEHLKRKHPDQVESTVNRDLLPSTNIMHCTDTETSDGSAGLEATSEIDCKIAICEQPLHSNFLAIDSNEMETNSTTAMHDSLAISEQEMMMKHRALWILKVKERCKLPQSTLDEILTDVTELCKDIILDMGQKITKVCKRFASFINTKSLYRNCKQKEWIH